MLHLPTFTADCLAAVRSDPTHRTVASLMRAAFTDPAAVMAAVGAPEGPGLTPIHVSPELTILNVVWAPGAAIRPHNHNTWAVIGIYCGREDNTFWRRLKDDAEGRIEPASTKSLSAGDVSPLGPDVIHSVTNPLNALTGAIHVYGGDFFTIDRSEWDPQALVERPYDIEKTRAMFAQQVEG